MELLVEDHSCRSELQEGHDFLVAWRGETVLKSSMQGPDVGFGLSGIRADSLTLHSASLRRVAVVLS